VLAAWLRYGRKDYPASVLVTAPLYALGKIPLYLGFVRRREQSWVRTSRDPHGGDGPGGASPRT
jgi:hypothetical protein